MAFQLKRPILVGGLGLTVSLWLLQGLHSSAHVGGSIVWSAIALGSGAWWLRQLAQKPLDLGLPARPVDRAAVDQEMATVEVLINQLAAEFPATASDATEAIANLRLRLAQLPAELERKQARLSIMGGKSVGKTTLTRLLASNWTTPQAEGQSSALATTVSTGAERTMDLGATDAAEVQSADLVMFVTTGDLTDPEFQAIEQLLNRHQRVLLVFNKQDQYLPDERLLVLQHLRERLSDRLNPDDVVAIAAQPAPVKVRQHQADGSVQERLEQSTPAVDALAERLKYVLANEGQQLILSTVMRQASLLKADVLTELNRLRRDRALPLIEQSQWIAAATAFANPVPSLDLLATAAINAQLIMDLGEIYQQKFSLQQAKTAAGAMGELMVKLGLVELSSQAIAPLLKSNTVTYVAGGLLQGVSAAYLTRMAGLTLVEYFQEQSQFANQTADSPFQLERLTQKLKAVFQANQRGAFLQTLVKQTVTRLTSQTSASTA
ncbi:MAG TPA: DUF697 domain-containing protein [Crinalium sp.]|jgi:hypothetical protein